MVNPRHNDVLEALPEDVYERLRPHLHLVSMSLGEMLQQPGQPIDSVYFPISALIGFSRNLADGTSMDTALIGPEGMVGIRGLISSGDHDVRVVGVGFAYRMPIEILSREMDTVSILKSVVLRCAFQTTKMIAVEGVCGHFHSIEQRLAKWLLIRCDRGRTDELHVTHQNIADSLGVRREAVTNALNKLSGLSNGRGLISVQDRQVLEQACCECYEYLRNESGNQMALPFPK